MGILNLRKYWSVNLDHYSRKLKKYRKTEGENCTCVESCKEWAEKRTLRKNCLGYCKFIHRVKHHSGNIKYEIEEDSFIQYCTM